MTAEMTKTEEKIQRFAPGQDVIEGAHLDQQALV